MNIGIFGASGAIGQRIVAEALSRRHSVTAFARDHSRIGPERVGVAWEVANILDAESIGRVINNVDVLVNSFGPGPSANASRPYASNVVEAAIRDAGSLVIAARALLKALERRPSLRLIVVGGAASLEISPGLQAVDAGPVVLAVLKEAGLPESYKAVMEAHRDAMNLYRISDRNWTYFCPAAITVPGERTGRFRLGGNQLVIGANGLSQISFEDYAAALLDEAEIPLHLQQRFTIGY
jgi:uncharacterized protein